MLLERSTKMNTAGTFGANSIATLLHSSAVWTGMLMATMGELGWLIAALFAVGKVLELSCDAPADPPCAGEPGPLPVLLHENATLSRNAEEFFRFGFTTPHDSGAAPRHIGSIDCGA
jgi:hypothetical protein